LVEPCRPVFGEHDVVWRCDQPVLTNSGLRAIQDVQDEDLLWDGVEWVAHDGVVFKGVKDVIEYDGLVATPDHIVFTENGTARLDQAERIIQSGCGDAPVVNGSGVDYKGARIPRGKLRTFDILNAGPRNRFTVSNRLVHNCGYQGGVGAFQAMAKAYGMRVTDERADEIKTAWRQANPWAPRLWRNMESAAMRAVRRPLEPQPVGRMHYVFVPDLLRGTLLLFMPSGRFLAYPEAAIKPVTKFDQPVDSLVFVHPEYGPSSTYGGALVENCLAADTDVLTDRGWVRIVDVRETDLLWDGVEWVSHGGLIYQGNKHTTVYDGVEMTPEHRILTEGGWHEVRTAQAEGLHGAAVRMPYGHREEVRHRADHAALSLESRPVYDLRNAGPRSRFVVRGRTAPLIVHNCTQGEAASLLRSALVRCDDAGIYSIGQVHDEIIIEHPASDIDRVTDMLVRIMEEPPEWADGLPLDADAEIGFRYKIERKNPDDVT